MKRFFDLFFILIFALTACCGCSSGEDVGGDRLGTVGETVSTVSVPEDLPQSADSGAGFEDFVSSVSDSTAVVSSAADSSAGGAFAVESSAVVSSAAVSSAAVVSSAVVSSDEAVVTSAPIPPADRALQILGEMSVEEKIGQVVLCRYPDNALQVQERFCFGGYTLYAKDFKDETEDSIKEKLSAVSAASKIPPFIAADEEGGSVVRISRYRQFSETPLPSLSEGTGDISAFAAKLAQVLRKGGVNLDLAPVCDVAENPYDYIYGRTCKLGYGETGSVIGALVARLNDEKIMCCLKHFPGYGSNVDTHTGIAFDNRTLSDFQTKDLIPFKKGIEAGAPMVMINHNIVAAYNAQVPASLSPEVHKALRELGFEGIIVTDDLGMEAISKYTSNPYADAFLAGNDLLCVSDGEACYNALYSGFLQGRITENRLNESVLRILRAKLKYEILK